MILKQIRRILLVAGFVLTICQLSYAFPTLQMSSDNGISFTTFSSGTPVVGGGITFANINVTANGIETIAPDTVTLSLTVTINATSSTQPQPVTVLVQVSDNGFSLPSGTASLVSTLTGIQTIADGTVSAQQFLNTNNQLFSGAGACTPGQPHGSEANITNTASVSCPITNPFSITESLNISIPAGQFATFTLFSAAQTPRVTSVPEPSAMFLLGVGLFTFRVLGRKR